MSVSLAEGLEGRRVPFTRIPMIDIGPFLDGSDKAGVTARIGEACRDVGFFYIRNHGIAQAEMDSAFAQAQRFFNLPLEAKNAVHISRSFPRHRGYIPIFGENTDPRVTADLKECFDLALELPPDHPEVRAGTPFHGANTWPDELPGFREAVYDHYLTMRRLALTLAGVMALSLDLPEDFFADKLDHTIATLRLIHYPPQAGRIEEETLGCGAHSDYGFLTVLAQDDVGGLQIRNSAGDWIAAPPIPGAFVINIGELIERWTNGLYRATRHRVINASGRERYSMPFFLDTNYNARIDCLETCHSETHPPKYPPVLGGDYLFQRYEETLNPTFSTASP